MSKKTKKATHKKNQTASLLARLNHVQEFVAAHAFVIVFVVGGLAIGFSLVRARSYLNPSRDEDKYTSAASKLNYSKVDQKVLSRLKLTQNDQQSQVSKNLAPNRTNPFNE
jgi:hypothetical protein